MFGLEDGDREELIPYFGLGRDPTLIIPLIGINIQAIELYNQLTFYSWDIGDPSRRSRNWKAVERFMVGYDAPVFVVDSTDRDRLFEARDELGFYLSLASATAQEGEDAKETVLLILATRCEFPEALDLSEIRDAFERELFQGER
ncbi:ADP-ribosylation factor-like protein 11, partial [Haplosporangium gracile]